MVRAGGAASINGTYGGGLYNYYGTAIYTYPFAYLAAMNRQVTISGLRLFDGLANAGGVEKLNCPSVAQFLTCPSGSAVYGFTSSQSVVTFSQYFYGAPDVYVALRQFPTRSGE